MSRRLLFGSSLVVLMFSACVILPPGVKVATPPTNIENPDRYRVDSASYPTFHVRERFKPPLWKEGSFEMVLIEASDIWKVTHKVGEKAFLIYSESYNDRQCRYLADVLPRGMAGGHIGIITKRCDADYLYHIPVNLDGTVIGNWKLLYNPKRFIFARDRYIDMQIDRTAVGGWSKQPLFVPQHKKGRKD
jgi:hypothetical protein